MACSYSTAFAWSRHKARAGLARSTLSALLGLAALFFALPAAAQETSGREPTVQQVASDVYFFFDYDGSNSVFLVTDEGVLVIDTRTHPREASDLLARIRKVTDKPIKCSMTASVLICPSHEFSTSRPRKSSPVNLG
jgi:hypothetical protein